MQSSARAKYMFVVASLVLAFLLPGINDRVLAHTTHVETVGWAVPPVVDMDRCGDPIDYSSCNTGQHCANCYAAVGRFSIIFDSSSENLAPRKPIPYLQVDDPPRLKPPRIS